jgi:tetratricopeptide (TPR) repeat protein
VAVLERQGKRAAVDSFVELAGRHIAGTLTWLQILGGVSMARGDRETSLRVADSLRARGDRYRKLIALRARAATYERSGQFARARRERVTAGAETWAVQDGAAALVHIVWQAVIDAEITGKVDAPRRMVDSALRAWPMDSIPAINRPWLELADFYYRTGSTSEGDRALAQVDPTTLGGTFSLSPDWVAGVGKLYGGKPAEALELFRKSHGFSFCDRCALIEMGQAFDALGQADSALAAYEAYRDTGSWDDFNRGRLLGPAIYRLGELYEGKGERTKAIESYSRFAEMWKEADPSLQPRVAEAKRRIAQLTAEPKP